MIALAIFMWIELEIELPLDLSGPPYNLAPQGQKMTIRVMLGLVNGDMNALWEAFLYRYGVCFKCPSDVPCEYIKVSPLTISQILILPRPDTLITMSLLLMPKTWRSFQETRSRQLIK